MTYVFFVEFSRVNDIAIFSSSIQRIHYKHFFNNQFNFIEFIFVQKINKQTFIQK